MLPIYTIPVAWCWIWSTRWCLWWKLRPIEIFQWGILVNDFSFGLIEPVSHVISGLARESLMSFGSNRPALTQQTDVNTLERQTWGERRDYNFMTQRPLTSLSFGIFNWTVIGTRFHGANLCCCITPWSLFQGERPNQVVACFALLINFFSLAFLSFHLELQDFNRF